MDIARPIPPRNGEGDQPKAGGGGPRILQAAIKYVKRARKLRKEMSPSEVLLWTALRQRPGEFKFRRQCPQSGYALDFACLETRLAIEVDGDSHDFGDRPHRDDERDRALERIGFFTMRVPAAEVFNNLEGVISGIVDLCRTRGPLHHAASRRGPPPPTREEI